VSELATWGHDPGRTDGALVLMAPGGTVMVALHWHLLRRKAGVVWRVRCVAPAIGPPGLLGAEVGSLHAVGKLADDLGAAAILSGGCQSWRIVTEGLFVARRKGRRGGPAYSTSILTLAEAAGEVVGPLRARQQGIEPRPRWSEWTKALLRTTGKAHRVNAYAARLAAQRWPELGELMGVEHVIDAAWLATYSGCNN